jgi:hypothetical protein
MTVLSIDRELEDTRDIRRRRHSGSEQWLGIGTVDRLTREANCIATS